MILLDGSNVNFIVAFVAGVVTFFASCLLPLVPTYLAYLTGISTSKQDRGLRVLKMGFLFTLGFILTFMVLGAGATVLGQFIGKYRTLVQGVGGIFFIVLGLFILDIIRPSIILKERKFELPKISKRGNWFTAVLMGVFFGFAWSPCVGPVLAVILFWASQANSVLKGTLLLGFYGLGLGLPFLVIAALFEKIALKLNKASKLGTVLRYISGVIIIVVGGLLLFGKMGLLSIWLVRLVGIGEYGF